MTTEGRSHVRVPFASWALAVNGAAILHREVCDSTTAEWKRDCLLLKRKRPRVVLKTIDIAGPHKHGGFSVVWNFECSYS